MQSAGSGLVVTWNGQALTKDASAFTAAGNAGEGTLWSLLSNATPGSGTLRLSWDGLNLSSVATFATTVAPMNTRGPVATGAATGTGTTASTASTATTTPRGTFLQAFTGTIGPLGDVSGVWDIDANIAGTRTGTTGGGAAGNRTINEAYAVAQTVSSRSARLSGFTSRNWVAVLGTYYNEHRVAPPPVVVSWRLPGPTTTLTRPLRSISPSLAAALAGDYLKTDWLLEAPDLGMKVSYEYDPDGTWTHQYARIGEVELRSPPGGGLAVVSDLSVQLYQDNTTQIASIWTDTTALEGREITLKLFAAGETSGYEIFRGRITQIHVQDGIADILATDDTFNRNILLPRTRVDGLNYPFAATTALARPFPLVYGLGSRVGAAPMVFVNTQDALYAISEHAMLTLGTNYATLDPGTQVLQFRTGDVTFAASSSPTTLQLTGVGAQGLRFNHLTATLGISRELQVTNALNVLDGSSSTVATIGTGALHSSLDGYGYLGVVGSFATGRGTNTLVVSATAFRRGLSSDPTTTAQFIVRTIDAGGLIVRDNLFTSQEFRHYLNPRAATFTVTNLQLAPAESIETLVFARHEGGVGTQFDHVTVGGLTMEIFHQPPGDELLFLGNTWQGRTDATGAITAVVGTLLMYPSDVVGSLIVDEIGLTLESHSWQYSRLWYMTRAWFFDGGIGAGWYIEQANARDILDDFARQGAAIVFPDFAGNWRQVPFDTTVLVVEDYTADDILWSVGSEQSPPANRTSTFEYLAGQLDSIHNAFEVRYKYNPSTQKFDGIYQASVAGSNAPNEGTALATLCMNSHARYGTLPPLVIDAYMIADDRTAERLLSHLVQYFWSQRLYATFDVPMQRGLSVLLGDFVTVTHPTLPAQDNGGRFEIHSIRYMPSLGRIRLGVSHLLSVSFEYTALRDQDSVIWYFWIDQAGQLVRDSVPPVFLGFSATSIVPTPIPYWWQVTDELGGAWYLYPDTDGTMLIAPTSPAIGTGLVVGLGQELQSPNAITYRIGAESWQVWTITPVS